MKNKGFTLVEVILAIAILGILAITFIPILSNQYLLIMKTGKKSEATYKTVDEIEKRLVEIDKEKELKGEKYIPKKITEIDVEFDNIKKIKLEVDHIEREFKYGKDDIKIDLGIPTKK